MEISISSALLLPPICLCLYFVKRYFLPGHEPNRLPPGPKPVPIIGHILHLTNQPHQALARLSRTHGPLLYLKLGRLPTIVVSSTHVAQDLFLNHDLAFSSRGVPDAARALDHHLHSMVWLPVSPKWRDLRKLAVIQLFSTKRLDESQKLRHRKVQELSEYVGECCRDGRPVDIGQVGFTTTLNLLSNTFFSKDLAGYSSESSRGFRDVVLSFMEGLGKPNLTDFFPVVRWLDPLGIRRQVTASFSKLFEVFDDMIKQRMAVDQANIVAEAEAETEVDVLDVLLRISKEGDFDLSFDDIKHLLLDFFGAGTDTTSSTLEWAMTELLRNPSKMSKAQDELNKVIGSKKAPLIEESDIEKLPYLQAIVKETLRLHPPAPLLVPHKTRQDIELCNYRIPENTQVLVNVWAIGRDPDTWRNPIEFLPERFLEGGEIDMKGRNFELIPFGAGRRMCPGLPLAYRMVHIMLATLLHGYGWKLANEMKAEDIDMKEKFGLTLQKAKPLLVVPIFK